MLESAAILVVEDREPISSVIADLLVDEGHAVTCVGDGAEALAWLHQHPTPAAIILDLNMPGMDGREFLDRRASDPRLASIPIVIISADAAHAAEFATRHRTQFLVKPFKLTDLLDVIAWLRAQDPPHGPGDA